MGPPVDSWALAVTYFALVQGNHNCRSCLNHRNVVSLSHHYIDTFLMYTPYSTVPLSIKPPLQPTLTAHPYTHPINTL